MNCRTVWPWATGSLTGQGWHWYQHRQLCFTVSVSTPRDATTTVCLRIAAYCHCVGPAAVVTAACLRIATTVSLSLSLSPEGIINTVCLRIAATVFNVLSLRRMSVIVMSAYLPGAMRPVFYTLLIYSSSKVCCPLRPLCNRNRCLLHYRLSFFCNLKTCFDIKHCMKFKLRLVFGSQVLFTL